MLVLQGLAQHGKDNFLAALMRIPHGRRTMYVHAYQSYLWNAATSERCLKYGTDKVMAGDLVLPSQESDEARPSENGQWLCQCAPRAIQIVLHRICVIAPAVCLQP